MKSTKKPCACFNPALIVLFLLLSLASTAQVHSFKHFGLDKNVFPSRIECVAQRGDGDLVIGTLAGLVRYDGHGFRTYTERDGMAENAISSLAALGDQLWVGHWAGSLTVIDCRSDRMRALDLQEALDYGSIVSIFPIDSSKALIISRDGALFMFIEDHLEQVALPAQNPDEKIIRVKQYADQVYALTSHGIYQCANQETFSTWTNIYQWTGPELTDAIFIQNGHWILGTKKGVFARDIRTNVCFEPALEQTYDRVKVVTLNQDLEEFIWIGTAEQGLVRYHPITREMLAIRRDNGLSYNQVRSVFVDREGSVWIGTAAGLDQFLGRAFQLFDRRYGLPDNIVWDFMEWQGKVLLATASGLCLIEPKIAEDPVKLLWQQSLERAEPRKLFATGRGDEVWVIDSEGRLWTGVPGRTFQEQDLNAFVRCIADVNGEIWLGTDQGILKMDGLLPSEQLTQETGLGGNKVNGIYYSKVRNETWITVLGGAAALYREGRFRKFGEAEGLTSNVIQDASFDRHGYPWFASYDEGVFYFDGEKFLNLSDSHHLTSNTTFAIDIDEDESVWIGHNWGIDVYRIPFGDVQHFGVDQGFMGIEVNPGAIRHDDQKNLWMGTLMGLLEFTPAHFRLNISEPITSITSIHLGDRDLLVESGPFRLDYDESELVVAFKGSSLVNPEKNIYNYRLLGVHESWRSTSSPEPITYTSLPPGEYVFELKTCNNSNICNSDPTRFSFVISPPFYKTWWFYTLVFLAIVLLIFLMDRYRAVSLMDAKNALSEELALKDQMLLDVQQDRDELHMLKNQWAGLAHQLLDGDMRVESDNSRFKGMRVLRMQHEAISSDHWMHLHIRGVDTWIFVDVGNTGPSAVMLYEWIKAELTDRFYRNIWSTAEQAQNLIQKALDQMTAGIEKHKGVQWFASLKWEGGDFAAARGVLLFVFRDGEAVEWKQAVGTAEGESLFDLSRLSPGDRVVLCSDGAAQLLSEDGTRNYSKKRLMKKLSECHSLSPEESLALLSADLERWRGTMPVYDDVTICIWTV